MKLEGQEAVAALAAALEALIADVDSCETEEDFILLASGYAIEQARQLINLQKGEQA